MNEKVAFHEKINSEFELVQIRFAEFKAQAKRLKLENQINQHAKRVEDLEQKVNATKTKLKEFKESDDDSWELLKDGVENTWTDLQATLQDTLETFKE
jgi:uncharacterized protein YlxW (UPF0749 family)